MTREAGAVNSRSAISRNLATGDATGWRCAAAPAIHAAVNTVSLHSFVARVGVSDVAAWRRASTMVGRTSMVPTAITVA